MQRKSRKTRSKPRANFNLTPRDLEIVRQLARYRFLSSRHLLGLVGGSLVPFLNRLTDLWEHGYLNRVQQNRDLSGWINRPEIYELTEAGQRLLTQHGIGDTDLIPAGRGDKAVDEYAHTLYLCHTLANIEIGAKTAGNSLISFQDILERAPLKTQERAKPYKLPCNIKHKVKPEQLKRAKADDPFTPDAIFGIRYPQGVKFYALEADMGTEPIYRKHLDNSSFYKKYLQYSDFMEKRNYESHLGLKNFRVLFVTKRPKPAPFLELVEKGNNFLLFQHTLAPDTTGRLYRAEWVKKGGGDYINQ